jgi:pimeloyl-ACP methyl ester carboxylesterase
MPFVRARGIDFYYEEYGEGPHLIVAHGLLASVAVLPRFAERIEDIAGRGVHVVAYDARGHGRSGFTKRRSDYSWSALAEDMHAFILALGITPANVYGGSMGAGTALMLALAHPEAVDKLILMSPPPFGDDMLKVRRTFGGLAALYRFLGTHLTARVVSMLPQTRRHTTPEQRDFLRSFLSNQRREAIVPAIRGLLFGPEIPIGRLSDIQHPALVLTHPDDPIHPLASGELLHSRMSHAELAVAPSATYWEKNPDALTQVVSAFVRGETIADGLPRHHEHTRA